MNVVGSIFTLCYSKKLRFLSIFYVELYYLKWKDNLKHNICIVILRLLKHITITIFLYLFYGIIRYLLIPMAYFYGLKKCQTISKYIATI